MRQGEKKQASVPGEGRKQKKRHGWVIALAVLVILALAGGYFLVNSPPWRYKKALEQREIGNYEEAVAILAELGDYEDSASLIPAIRYEEAEAKREAGDWSGARTAFEQAGDYRDAETQIFATWYAEGEALAEAGEYEAAISAFTSAGDYRDAAERIPETRCRQAEALRAEGKYADACLIYAQIIGYADVREKLSGDPELVQAALRTPGAIVCLGSYEQDDNTENGKEPIEWLVLDVQDGKTLLLSRYALDCQKYHKTNIGKYDNNWEYSSLRKWLNDAFLKEAFDQAERSVLVADTVDNSPEQGTGFYGGKNTNDSVFLLSVKEAKDFFPEEADRTCKATAYAQTRGAVTDVLSGSCVWWLRSPGINRYEASIVNRGGMINSTELIKDFLGVRPAVWVDPGKIAFIIPGSVVSFGAYEQDNDPENGKEPVEWVVMDVQDGKSLLLSRLILDCRPYSADSKDVTWDTCSLRKWLNSDFISEAFSREEQKKIPWTTVAADGNPEYDTGPGRDTSDHVFLLSITEAERTFAADADRACTATPYTIALGCYGNPQDGSCCWWLRTPGANASFAAFVDSYGVVKYGGDAVSSAPFGVRPALWLDLGR